MADEDDEDEALGPRPARIRRRAQPLSHCPLCVECSRFVNEPGPGDLHSWIVCVGGEADWAPVQNLEAGGYASR